MKFCVNAVFNNRTFYVSSTGRFGVVLTALIASTKLLYTSSSASTDTGDCSRLYVTQPPSCSEMETGTSQGQGVVAVLCGWEGNRMSGVALPMCHRLVSSYRLNGLRKGDEHPLCLYLLNVPFRIIPSRRSMRE